MGLNVCWFFLKKGIVRISRNALNNIIHIYYYAGKSIKPIKAEFFEETQFSDGEGNVYQLLEVLKEALVKQASSGITNILIITTT